MLAARATPIEDPSERDRGGWRLVLQGLSVVLPSAKSAASSQAGRCSSAWLAVCAQRS